jgi:putative endonuclease
MNYFVYIINCQDESLYTGITTNLEKRIKQHDGKLKGGAKYTRGKGPVKLIYFEEYKTRSEALKREAEIKKLKREEKLLLPASSASPSTATT